MQTRFNQARRAALLCVLPALFVGVATAKVYRWVDADGQVHYGDRPPAAASGQAVQFQPGSSADTAQRQQQADAEAIAVARAEQCTTATQQLDAYSRAASLVMQDPDGEQRELSTAERDALIAETAARKTQYCGPGREPTE